MLRQFIADWLRRVADRLEPAEEPAAAMLPATLTREGRRMAEGKLPEVVRVERPSVAAKEVPRQVQTAANDPLVQAALAKLPRQRRAR